MRTGRRTHTAETPASLFPEALTIKPILQTPSIKAKRNHGLKKKKKKCILTATGLWDSTIPPELLQEILSRVGPKANIQASAVCKTWFEAAVSVRKFQPIPWIFYPSKGDTGDYILFDPSSSRTYKKNVPDLKGHKVLSCSRDGWFLVVAKIKKSSKWVFFFNPFTRERIYLPNWSRRFFSACLAFSAAPTSTSCMVISFTQLTHSDNLEIVTWRPGETIWTIHYHSNPSSSGIWNKCVFSNGLFYALSSQGYAGVFDPSKATWDVLPVTPLNCPAFSEIKFSRNVVLMEHDGNIFVTSTRCNNNNNRSVFRLNLERMVWEEKSDVFGGLTVFASYIDLVDDIYRRRSCSGTYPSTTKLLSLYYSLFDEIKKSSRPPTSTSWSNHAALVDPPHNNVNLGPFFVLWDDESFFVRL